MFVHEHLNDQKILTLGKVKNGVCCHSASVGAGNLPIFVMDDLDSFPVGTCDIEREHKGDSFLIHFNSLEEGVAKRLMNRELYMQLLFTIEQEKIINGVKHIEIKEITGLNLVRSDVE